MHVTLLHSNSHDFWKLIRYEDVLKEVNGQKWWKVFRFSNPVVFLRLYAPDNCWIVRKCVKDTRGLQRKHLNDFD